MSAGPASEIAFQARSESAAPIAATDKCVSRYAFAARATEKEVQEEVALAQLYKALPPRDARLLLETLIHTRDGQLLENAAVDPAVALGYSAACDEVRKAREKPRDEMSIVYGPP